MVSWCSSNPQDSGPNEVETSDGKTCVVEQESNSVGDVLDNDFRPSVGGDGCKIDRPPVARDFAFVDEGCRLTGIKMNVGFRDDIPFDLDGRSSEDGFPFAIGCQHRGQGGVIGKGGIDG